MVVGIVRFELHLPAAQSLKDKRQVVRSMKERLRERVHASVAEVEYQDLWQRAASGFAIGLQATRLALMRVFRRFCLPYQPARS